MCYAQYYLYWLVGGYKLTILGMYIEPGILAGIVAYSFAVTILTNWLVTGFRRPTMPRRMTLDFAATILINLIWIVVICAFGVLAIRYIERIASSVFGYVLFAAVGFLLSWMHAYLHRRIRHQRKSRPPIPQQALASMFVHNSTYLLFAIVLYLAFCGLLRQPIEPVLLLPMCIGALLPDLDSRASLPGRLFPWLSRRLEDRLGHLEEWHTLAATVLVALVTAPLIPLFGVQTWYLIPFGFLTHLLLDLLAPRGVLLLWPATRTRYSVFGGAVSPGRQAERTLAAVLFIAGLLLLFAVDLGSPEPPPAPTLSYEQTLERYYSMRGKTQTFAYMDGSWQISGRPISGRFEILNAFDRTFIMLDRYSGKIFTAGRTAEDNIYANRIVLQGGSSVQVKPVEAHLENQPLGDALDIVYDMQKEPGLQHIYVSGELLLPDVQSEAGQRLQADLSQTSLRKIQLHSPGHYSVQYLSAADLIQLADLQVDIADLVIVATYVRPATGPTVTPLPPPSSTTKPTRN